jgi:hypothetical protein
MVPPEVLRRILREPNPSLVAKARLTLSFVGSGAEHMLWWPLVLESRLGLVPSRIYKLGTQGLGSPLVPLCPLLGAGDVQAASAELAHVIDRG